MKLYSPIHLYGIKFDEAHGHHHTKIYLDSSAREFKINHHSQLTGNCNSTANTPIFQWKIHCFLRRQILHQLFCVGEGFHSEPFSRSTRRHLMFVQWLFDGGLGEGWRINKGGGTGFPALFLNFVQHVIWARFVFNWFNKIFFCFTSLLVQLYNWMGTQLTGNWHAELLPSFPSICIGDAVRFHRCAMWLLEVEWHFPFALVCTSPNRYYKTAHLYRSSSEFIFFDVLGDPTSMLCSFQFLLQYSIVTKTLWCINPLNPNGIHMYHLLNRFPKRSISFRISGMLP